MSASMHMDVPESAAQAQSRVLERIATGAPLAEVMAEVVTLVEHELPGSSCSVLVLDGDGQHLHVVAAASLPTSYNAAIEGAAIGPRAGSCGTAAFRGEVVDVLDISTDPLWADYRALALGYGLRSCISMPIFGGTPKTRAKVLGTFALYRHEVTTRSAEVRDVLHRAAHLAGVALDRENAAREIQRGEEQLRQAAKMEAIGRLAGGIAHDFNNLLTVINGCAEMLHTDLPGDDPNQDLVGSIREAGQRAADLTRQLLAFSRKVVVEPKDVDVNAVVGAVNDMLRRLLGESVLLVSALDAEPCIVHADPMQLEQVVINLAVNARDAMPGGGVLTVRTRRITLTAGERRGESRPLAAGAYIELAVADTGTGISESLRTKVFEPFFTTKPVGEGTGLGLATVYGIVEQAGGSLRIESTLGKGTTFHVLLPEVIAVVPPVATMPSNPARAGTESILLVEDEAALRRLAQAILTRYGYRVIVACSGEEALRVLDTHDGAIALLLTDVVMPGMGGAALAASVRERCPDVRVLYMSGHADDAVDRHGVSTAHDALLHKPFTRLALAHSVRDLLDRP